jgi:nitrogen fixation NifU-like protein
MNSSKPASEQGQDLQQRIQDAIQNPRNLGEMQNADAVGTVGSPDCGDMLRMWVKFKEDEKGRRVIDRATFQTFGCETAIAVASVATELISGKTIEEALSMSGSELAAPLGPLPPMKIHCAQLVEGALRSALTPPRPVSAPAPGADSVGDTGGLLYCAAPSESAPPVDSARMAGQPSVEQKGPPSSSNLLESFAAPAVARVRLRPKDD